MGPHRNRALVVLGLCSLMVGTAAVTLRIRQRLVRVHAQHILDSLQHLEIGNSRACEGLSEWQKEWKSYVTSEGSCDGPNQFNVNIHVQHPPYLWHACFEHQDSRLLRLPMRGICGTYEVLSGRPIVFTARLEGLRGFLTRKSASVFAVVPDDSADEDLSASVHASADSPVRLDWRRSRTEIESDLQQQRLHPGYRVFIGTSRANADYNPGGRIFYTEVAIGAEGGKSDSERLFRFDLSCLTRMRPCSRRDLMPAAYDQHEMDMGHSESPSPR
jgi:hypothetical protein